jgi:hypothetical protein
MGSCFRAVTSILCAVFHNTSAMPQLFSGNGASEAYSVIVIKPFTLFSELHQFFLSAGGEAREECTFGTRVATPYYLTRPQHTTESRNG